MPPAIAGSGGHTATFNAAIVLMRGFALSAQDAWPCLLEWNRTHCQPPWTQAELRNKLRSSTNSSRPLGYLLNGDRSGFESSVPEFANEEERKKRQRQSWPRFRVPNKGEIENLSLLRGLPASALWAAVDAQVLVMCRYDEVDCFALREGDFAQARRLNGQLMRVQDGACKAKNLPGSVGVFIGSSLLGDSPNVLLVEGCIGLLEAMACISLADVSGWTVIAATSASSRFHRDPELIAQLKGRHVRIVPDADKQGLDAASCWLAELDHAGISASAMDLPSGHKDLGSIVSDFLKHTAFLTALFQ